MTQEPFSGSQGSTYGGMGTGSSAQSMGSEAKEKAGEAVGEAKRIAGQATEQGKEQATSFLETQKGRVADQMVTVAQALRQTSQHLSEEGQVPVGKYVNRAAEQVERTTNYLRTNEVPRLLDDTQALARRSPGVFIATSVALGMAAARFLMSSGQRARQAQYRSTAAMGEATPYRPDVFNSGAGASYTRRAEAMAVGDQIGGSPSAGGSSMPDVRDPHA